MELIALLFWFIFLVTQEVKADTTTASTGTNTVNTIDILQNQLNQILVQFCASEIDRNKTASAILKFGQLANPNASIENVVDFYIENYEESFDNLLHFINHISSLELQLIAYNTLVEAMKLNQINVINLLSFENFIRTKFEVIDDVESIERKNHEDLLLLVGNHIKELIVSTDLNRVIAFINNSTNPDRIFELIPTIVKGIDLNNFTDMNRIFEFSLQLPNVNQIKLISKVLSEMREKTQYKHVFHVIGQIRKLRTSFHQEEDKCLLSQLENEVPLQLLQLLSGESRWQIKYYNSDELDELESAFLSYSNSPKYLKNLLFVSSAKVYDGWKFFGESYNSVAIGVSSYNQYLSVEYCFHGDSFPTTKTRTNSDLTQYNWYLLMSDDLSYVQIKNIVTNELLIVDYVREDKATGVRVALSSKCSDCIASRWSLELVSGSFSSPSLNCNNRKHNRY